VKNVDSQTVAGFGDEWSRFDQSVLSEKELNDIFTSYFKIFPWTSLPEKPVGFDLGCGSGRWAKIIADKVSVLHCIDASADALTVARRNLLTKQNCVFHLASVDSVPLQDDSMDFGYSLGVLHHIPNTQEGIKACVKKLKKGSPFLLYLYYAFDNRPIWFIMLWKLSNIFRRIISRMPFVLRYWITQLIALIVYYPLAKFALSLEKLGYNVDNFPLTHYRHRSFYTMRTDALDRFGTRLEQRFTAAEIEKMMKNAGLDRITFSDSVFWAAVGFKKK
jgi:SAM-dependent methyltransferase